MKSRILMALTAGVLLLGACKGKSSDYEAYKSDNVTANADTSLSPAAKLIKTADMRFKVKNVQQAGEAITALTVKSGGMVMHHSMQTNVDRSQDIRISDDSLKRVSAFSTCADMTIKLPSEKLGDFMTQVAHMGIYVNTRKMDIEDMSLDYLSERLKLQNRKELVDQQKQGKVIIKNPVNVMLLKDDMVDQQIGNMKTDAAVKYSTITLSFYQNNTIMQEVVANDDPSAYQLPFFKRLALAFNNGWFLFTSVLLGIANLWVFIAAGAGLWLLYKYYKKKRPELFAHTIKS